MLENPDLVVPVEPDQLEPIADSERMTTDQHATLKTVLDNDQDFIMDRGEFHRAVETMKVIGMITEKIEAKMYADSLKEMNKLPYGFEMSEVMPWFYDHMSEQYAEEFMNIYPHVAARYDIIPLFDDQDKAGQVITKYVDSNGDIKIDLDEYEYLLDQLVDVGILPEEVAELQLMFAMEDLELANSDSYPQNDIYLGLKQNLEDDKLDLLLAKLEQCEVDRTLC